MNKAILMGRLTRDPEVRYSQNNLPITTFTLAIDRRFVKQGEERQADFIPIVTFGKTAEFCEKYYRKGQQVLVVGRIQTRTWDDNEGKRHYMTEVVSDEAYFADSKRQDGGGAGGRPDDFGYFPAPQQGGGDPGGSYGGNANGSYGGSSGGSYGGSSGGAYGGNAGGSYGGGGANAGALGSGSSPYGPGAQAFGNGGGSRGSGGGGGGKAVSNDDDDGFMPVENESDLPF